MIDFDTLKALTIPEGVVTQITDASGRVLWALNVGGPVILEVEKITSDTYAGETTYTGEQFILLDIYPKTNGTVSVTYGGLTKTITDTSGAAKPNAQQVFFGTFNGVSDSVATPTSGELTIEGNYIAFACSSYQVGSKSYNVSFCSCITAVNEWGNISQIMPSAFRNCTSLALTELPNSITNIGSSAFYGCTSLALTSLPSGITSISDAAFNGCTALALTSLPSGITSIGSNAFSGCTSLVLTSLPSGLTSISDNAFNGCTSITSVTTPNGLVSIGKDAFYKCDNLKSIIISDSVTSIGDTAFHLGHNGLKPYTCTIGRSVSTIGSGAFYNNIGTVTILATTPPTAGANVVGGEGADSRTTVIVPKGCSSAYTAADVWSSYNIVEAS